MQHIASPPIARVFERLIRPRARSRLLPVSLALQGGGAHGAFTWGALDRLLEEPDIRIQAISGTSAGALNAAVLAAGYLDAGRDGARKRLAELWKKLAQISHYNPLRPTPLETAILGRNADLSATHIILDSLAHHFSPYQLNPLDINPLRETLLSLVDFKRLQRSDEIALFVAATKMETGDCRVFTNNELCPEVLIASTSLPSLHQAARIDGQYYWDGGFTANPPIWPLIDQGGARDIFIVRLACDHDGVQPVTAARIRARLASIIFDAPLKRELDSIERLKRITGGCALFGGAALRRLARLRLHPISDSETMGKLGDASRLHADWKLIRALHDAGRAAAERALIIFRAA